MIGKFKFIKNLIKNVGNFISNVATSKIVNSVVNKLAPAAGFIPVVGRVAEKMIKNIPNNYDQFGKLIYNIGDGKNVIKSLDNYNKNTSFGAPFSGLAIGGSLINTIKNSSNK